MSADSLIAQARELADSADRLPGCYWSGPMVALAAALEAAEAQRDTLRGHVIYLLGYIGVDRDADAAELEALGAPPGIVAARAALAGVAPPEEQHDS